MIEDKFPEDHGCILHPKCVTCPEIICAYEFPGGPGALLRYREMRTLLDQGFDINSAAQQLGIAKSTAQRRFIKVHGGRR